MISGCFFIDGKAREFVPYQGWLVINVDGTREKDTLMEEPKGSFRIIVDEPSHGNWHSLYNLVDDTGRKLLSKGIRTIKHLPKGLFLLEDNNEDELINKGDVRGGFRISEHESKMNVMCPDGHLLSNEWFDRVEPELDSFVCWRGDCKYRLDNRGRQINELFVRLSFGCTLVSQEDGICSIYDSMYRVITSGFTSAMYIQTMGIWNINLLSRGKTERFLFGEAPQILCYAQQILIRGDVLALVEREGVWYILTAGGNETGCLVWNPSDIF